MVTLISTAKVQTPGLTVAPLGERRLLVTVTPLGAPRNRERKGGRLKTPEVGSDEANQPSHSMFPEM